MFTMRERPAAALIFEREVGARDVNGDEIHLRYWDENVGVRQRGGALQEIDAVLAELRSPPEGVVEAAFDDYLKHADVAALTPLDNGFDAACLRDLLKALVDHMRGGR